MGGVIALLALFGTAGALLGVIARQHRRRLRHVFDVNALQMGLELEHSGVSAASETDGVTFSLRADRRPGRHLVTLGRPGWPRRSERDSHEDPSLVATAALPQPLPLSVNHEPVGAVDALSEAAWRHADTGDETFDRRVRIQGPEDEVRALLNGHLRRLLLDVVDRGGTFDGRTLELRWRAFADPSVNAAGFESLRAAALGLSHAALALHDPVRGMADVAGHDPEAGVRGACLLRLITAHGAHRLTVEAATRALDDRAPAVRVLAAAHLDAHDHLLRLLEGAPDADVVTRAIEALGRTRAGRRGLRRHLDRLGPEARARAVRLLVEHGEVAAGGLALAQVAGGELAVAADGDTPVGP